MGRSQPPTDWVVFLTPVLVHAARRRQLDDRPFLYGSVFMANAASLLLPGSNLTNLLVLRSDLQSGAAFAARMLPAWIVACTLTAAFLSVAFRLHDGRRANSELPPLRIGVGALATLAAATLVVALPNAAIPVLAVGLGATALRRLRPQLDPRALTLLFALAVGLGTVARLWHGPAHLVDSSGVWTVAGIGAVASVLLNNLPAAVLLSAQPTAHPHALLLGLDLGPNLAVTGSLSAVLWLQAACAVDARASITTYSRLGLISCQPPLSARSQRCWQRGPRWIRLAHAIHAPSCGRRGPLGRGRVRQVDDAPSPRAGPCRPLIALCGNAADYSHRSAPTGVTER